MIYLEAKFHMPISNCSLVINTFPNLKANEGKISKKDFFPSHSRYSGSQKGQGVVSTISKNYTVLN